MPKYYSPSGNIEVWDEKPSGYYTEKEWAEMHPPTPYVPTVEEKLDALDAQYNADKERIRGAYQDAQIYGKTGRMEQLKADLEALDAQYDIDYEAIVGGDE